MPLGRVAAVGAGGRVLDFVGRRFRFILIRRLLHEAIPSVVGVVLFGPTPTIFALLVLAVATLLPAARLLTSLSTSTPPSTRALTNVCRGLASLWAMLVLGPALTARTPRLTGFTASRLMATRPSTLVPQVLLALWAPAALLDGPLSLALPTRLPAALPLDGLWLAGLLGSLLTPLALGLRGRELPLASTSLGLRRAPAPTGVLPLAPTAGSLLTWLSGPTASALWLVGWLIPLTSGLGRLLGPRGDAGLLRPLLLGVLSSRLALAPPSSTLLSRGSLAAALTLLAGVPLARLLDPLLAVWGLPALLPSAGLLRLGVPTPALVATLRLAARRTDTWHPATRYLALLPGTPSLLRVLTGVALSVPAARPMAALPVAGLAAWLSTGPLLGLLAGEPAPVVGALTLGGVASTPGSSRVHFVVLSFALSASALVWFVSWHGEMCSVRVEARTPVPNGVRETSR